MVIALFLLACVPASSASQAWALHLLPHITSSSDFPAYPTTLSPVWSSCHTISLHRHASLEVQLFGFFNILHSDFLQHLFLDAATLENLQQQSLEETK